jgi:hypothetical protein
VTIEQKEMLSLCSNCPKEELVKLASEIKNICSKELASLAQKHSSTKGTRKRKVAQVEQTEPKVINKRQKKKASDEAQTQTQTKTTTISDEVEATKGRKVLECVEVEVEVYRGLELQICRTLSALGCGHPTMVSRHCSQVQPR